MSIRTYMYVCMYVRMYCKSDYRGSLSTVFSDGEISTCG